MCGIVMEEYVQLGVAGRRAPPANACPSDSRVGGQVAVRHSRASYPLPCRTVDAILRYNREQLCTQCCWCAGFLFATTFASNLRHMSHTAAVVASGVAVFAFPCALRCSTALKPSTRTTPFAFALCRCLHPQIGSARCTSLAATRRHAIVPFRTFQLEPLARRRLHVARGMNLGPGVTQQVCMRCCLVPGACRGEFHHGSWKVYRSQGELLAGSSAPAAAGSVSGPTPASCPVSADSTSFGAEDGWGNAGDWGDASEATGASRWGDVPASPDTKPDVLPAPARPTYLMKLARTLPCYDVSNMYEPEGSDAEDSDEEVEGSVSASAARRHADASDDAALAHAKKLWAEYQSWEASTSALSKEAPTSGAAPCDPDSERDASTSSLVPGHGAEAEMEGMESADSDGEELATDVTSAARGVAASVHADGRVAGGKDWDGEHPKSTRKAAQRRVSGGDKRAGVMRTDRGGSALVSSRGADSDDDENLPPAVAASLAFQRRLQRLPTQCVRYSFGTQPLWPHVPPKGWDAAIPRCVCGARRLFECQLMPALLQQLCVDEHVVCTPSPDTAAVRTPPPPPSANTKRSAGTKSTARAAGAGAGSSDSASASSPPALLSMLDTGMDFSTVLVYSCEDSCDMSNEELAFVLPPL
ncbi:MAG: hypothetical protein EOO65_01220 [Methanosarcinales archaeon]|nr:MAG: hypothetical protein EOO65_01220 [Methanosarcinales archaeon]